MKTGLLVWRAVVLTAWSAVLVWIVSFASFMRPLAGTTLAPALLCVAVTIVVSAAVANLVTKASESRWASTSAVWGMATLICTLVLLGDVPGYSAYKRQLHAQINAQMAPTATEANPFDQFDQRENMFDHLIPAASPPAESQGSNSPELDEASAAFFKYHPEWSTPANVALLQARINAVDSANAAAGNPPYTHTQAINVAYRQLKAEGY